MKANELRTRNWITWQSTPNDIEKVLDIKTAGIKNPTINNVNIKDVKPIPLTEEWFDRFGSPKYISARGLINPSWGFPLKNYKTLKIKNNREIWVYSFNEKLLRIFTDYTTRYGGRFKLAREIKIEHVHTFQNLYFALTNTELT